MICFHFIIFEPSETTLLGEEGVVRVVVICFHFIIFEPSETTECHGTRSTRQLWFAFISLSLSHQKQLKSDLWYCRVCCDLLSFHYLWAIRNNILSVIIDSVDVVICFHFIIFEPSETTAAALTQIQTLLWFAFISLSLSHQKQQKGRFYPDRRVVICFHFIIFEPSETTFCPLPTATECCDLLSFHYLWAIRNNRKRPRNTC